MKFSGEFENEIVDTFQIVERRDDTGIRELQLFVTFKRTFGIFTGILDETDIDPICDLKRITGKVDECL